MRWLRRLFRRRPPVPAAPVDLTPLDRLADVIERAVAVLEARREREKERPVARRVTPPPPPAPVPAPEPPVLRAVPPPPDGAHVVLAGDPAGYRLLERAGPPPLPGERLEFDGVAYEVVRLGPSPLPGDERRCASLVRGQPLRAAAGAAA